MPADFRYMLLPSVCLSSVVGNARAPYSGGYNFRQYFYSVWYVGHPLISTENFMEVVPGEPLRQGNCVWAFDWYQNRWSWMTLNGVLALFCIISANSDSFRAHCVKVHVRYLISWWILVIATYHLPPSGGLNARGVAKCSDFGPIEGYISEMVQDKR